MAAMATTPVVVDIVKRITREVTMTITWEIIVISATVETITINITRIIITARRTVRTEVTCVETITVTEETVVITPEVITLDLVLRTIDHALSVPSIKPNRDIRKPEKKRKLIFICIMYIIHSIALYLNFNKI